MFFSGCRAVRDIPFVEVVNDTIMFAARIGPETGRRQREALIRDLSGGEASWC